MNILKTIKNRLQPVSEFDRLVEELVEIGSRPRGKGDSGGYLREGGAVDKRTVEIGKRLFEMGGHEMMLRAHAEVRKRLRGSQARELEACWDGIGRWRG